MTEQQTRERDDTATTPTSSASPTTDYGFTRQIASLAGGQTPQASSAWQTPPATFDAVRVYADRYHDLVDQIVTTSRRAADTVVLQSTLSSMAAQIAAQVSTQIRAEVLDQIRSDLRNDPSLSGGQGQRR